MAQMIQYGWEFVRINTQKNSIEYSVDGGRNWYNRRSGYSTGVFTDLFQAGSGIIFCTSKGIWDNVA